jgi:hypothetical protein
MTENFDAAQIAQQLRARANQTTGRIVGMPLFANSTIVQTAPASSKNHFDITAHIKRSDLSDVHDFPEGSLAKSMGPPIEFFKVNSTTEAEVTHNIDKTLFELKIRNLGRNIPVPNKTITASDPNTGIKQIISLSSIQTKESDFQKMLNAERKMNA